MDKAVARQRELPFGVACKVDALYDEWLERVAVVLDRVGRKEVVYETANHRDLKLSPEFISHALRDRKGHHFRARHALYFRLLDSTGELARFDAGCAGYEVAPVRPLSWEERALRLERRVREKFGETGEAAILEAYTR